MTLQQQDKHQSQIRVDLYELELQLYHNNERKLLNRLQNHGEIKEERYIWGQDDFNRPRREKLVISFVLHRAQRQAFLTMIKQLDNGEIHHRKVSTLV